MNNKKYNLGLVSISFRQHTPMEIATAANKAGITHIEWGSDVHAPCTDSKKLDEIVALQKEYNLTCSSYGTYFRLGETPFEELPSYIAAAKHLGTNILRLWCETKNGSEMTRTERENLVNECQKAAKLAEKQEVILCMECHQNTFTENPDDAVFLMNEVNSPNFRMYWQPFQQQTFDWNIESAKKIAPYAEHLHVFNWKGTERFPLSEAVNEWQAYLNHFPAPRTLLLEFMPNDTLDELETESKALKTITEVKSI